jgi:hypothetical protein
MQTMILQHRRRKRLAADGTGSLDTSAVLLSDINEKPPPPAP